MDRHRHSSITGSLPLIYYLPQITARSIISKHLVNLTHKRELIDQIIKTKKGKYLDIAERELLRSRPCVLNQMEVLEKLSAKLGSESTIYQRALNEVEELLQELDETRALISEAEEYLSLGIYLDTSQWVVLRSKSVVVHQMYVLESIFREISLAQLPFLTVAKEVAEYQFSPLLRGLCDSGLLGLLYLRGFEHESLVESLLSEFSRMRAMVCFNSFNMMQAGGFSRANLLDEDSPSAVESAGKPEIEPEWNRIGEFTRDCTTEYAGTKFVGRWKSIRNLCDSGLPGLCDSGLLGLLNSRGFEHESLVESLLSEFSRMRAMVFFNSFNLMQAGGFSRANLLDEDSPSAVESIRNLKFSPGMNEKETREVVDRVKSEQLHKQRYLCVTNGFEIFCLDLKQRKDQTFSISQDVPTLPKIACLKLLEECDPVASVGLFKWRSNTYMICGMVLKSLVDNLDSSKSRFRRSRSLGKWGRLLKKLYKRGSSRDIRLFSLAEDGTSSHSESNIGKLNKPKFWPVVENIDGEMHLIDSLPPRLVDSLYGWTFSHEVFNPDSGTWTEISSPIEDVLHIDSYLVVGDCIFAVSPMGLLFESHSAPSYLMFKSKTKEWELCKRERHSVSIKDVWDILELGRFARCAGQFRYGNSSRPLYAIIALVNDRSNFDMGTLVMAYLVTPEGMVVCTQVLHSFFTGPVFPCEMSEAKLIDADHGEMCSIVIATAWEHYFCRFTEYVFANTFSVKDLTYAASQVQELLEKGTEAWPVVLDFVRVDIVDKCVYKKVGELEEEDDSSLWVGVQACFP